MTDHSPGSATQDAEDDDYRLGPDRPEEASPRPELAEPERGGSERGESEPGESQRAESERAESERAESERADGPPPQVSGLPGWAAEADTASASATASIPRQVDAPDKQPDATPEGPTAAQQHAIPGAYAVSGWPQRELPTLPPLPDTAPSSGLPFQRLAPLRTSPKLGVVAAWVGGGVALATLLVTAVVLTFDDGGDGSGTNSGSAAASGGVDNVRTLSAGWTVPGNSTDHQVGTWVTGQYLVRATQSGVRAYSLADGTPAWTAHPLSGPSVPCAMSPTVSTSGVGTIGFGPDTSDCTTLVGVDTRSGKTLWSTPLTTKDHSAPAPATTFVDGQVGVIVNSTVVGGVDLTDGHVVWGYKPRGQYCNAYPYGGADTVLVDDYCADLNSTYTVSALDAATGKQLWQKQGTDHVQFGAVLDGSPVVATVSGASGTTNVYDASGTPKPLTVTGRIDNGLGSAGGSDSGAQAVNASTLVLPVRDATQSKPILTAVNLTTGASRWTYDGEAHLGAVLARPQGADGGGKLYAVSLAHNYGEGANPELVSLDPTTGAATVLAQLPATPASLIYTTGTVYVLPDGRVILVSADDTGTAVRSFK